MINGTNKCNTFSSFPDGSEEGLKEDEYEASIATLQSLAATLEADCVLLRQIKVDQGLTGQYLVRKRLDQQDFLEIRFTILNDSGLQF